MLNLKDGTLWQWDTGRKIIVTLKKGSTIDKVQFYNGIGDNAYPATSIETVNGEILAGIPNSLLCYANNLTVYLMTTDEDGVKTQEQITLVVNKRAKPEDYIFTDDEFHTYQEYDERLVALEKSNEALDVGIAQEAQARSDADRELAEDLAFERARIDNLTRAEESGLSTDAERELVDIRVDHEGKIHESAGDAVRYQTEKFLNQIDALESDLFLKVNLYNKNDLRNRENTHVEYNKISNLEGFFATHPIKVEANKRYITSESKLSGVGNSGVAKVVDYDGNSLDGYFLVSIDSETGNMSFTSTKDCYVMLDLGNKETIKNTFMVCEQSKFTTTYIPFNAMSDDFIDYLSTYYETNPLKGKVISFNGDSICYGAGSSGGYGKIIADKNKMIYENIAVSGATIKAETYSDNIPKHWICRTVNNMRADADYAIFEGGVNDGKGNLGVLSVGYEAELDDTTFYGAFESMLKQARERFKGKKIGYIFAHKCTESFSSSGDEYNPYYAAKKCLEKWGVSYLDLNTECPPLAFIPSLKEMYTHNGDGWHPNDLGYRTYYVPKIEAWLKTL